MSDPYVSGGRLYPTREDAWKKRPHDYRVEVVANGCGRYVCSCGWRSEVHCDGDRISGWEAFLIHLGLAERAKETTPVVLNPREGR